MEIEHPQANTYKTTFRHVRDDFINLAHYENRLAQLESRNVAYRLVRHSLLAAFFIGLLAASAFPLIAFFVIGLGQILSGNYWLSSLLIGMAGFVIGGTMSLILLWKIKNEDLRLPQAAPKISAEAILDRIEDFKVSASGQPNDASATM